MFLFGITDYDYKRLNFLVLKTKEARDELESRLDSVLQTRPSSFKISGFVFIKTPSDLYEVIFDGRIIKICDIDDFFFEELPEAQDFVIVLTFE